ncbi:MAG: beta-N-acetylhexosaminidase [Alphaproteobacteria bacterium]|nr:beta-N-acetylhexosaminidase [Alphaproteobacteria bacterium]
MSESEARRPKPVMFGCEGTRLSRIERDIFRSADPFGFILFKRNCESPDQIRYLIQELRQAAGRDTVSIAIDQEGGRVSRLQPPHWPKYPAARAFGLMYERDADWGVEAIKLYARILSYELVNLGIAINCAPVLDLYNPTGTEAMGDRAFSERPTIVAALARAQAETFLASGILPVIKHLPGHGRLKTDPHHVLPQIDAGLTELETQDFVPFELLKDLPLGMNSHAVFRALDPDKPASLSSLVNNDIIRDIIGFDGVLFSDDICMKALDGKPADIARHALDAGNDIVLHCNGDASEMEAVARVLEPMEDQSWARWQHARAMVAPLNPAYNPGEDAARLDVLLGGLAFDATA